MDELINMLSPSREFTEDDTDELNKIIYLPTPLAPLVTVFSPAIAPIAIVGIVVVV